MKLPGNVMLAYRSGETKPLALGNSMTLVPNDVVPVEKLDGPEDNLFTGLGLTTARSNNVLVGVEHMICSVCCKIAVHLSCNAFSLRLRHAFLARLSQSSICTLASIPSHKPLNRDCIESAP